ncbi:MAG: protein-glutamine glutaminase family protein [Chlamydiales bacterium]|nr:protein-glutamine glutaminase family protein [Chlamydiales bacterium]
MPACHESIVHAFIQWGAEARNDLQIISLTPPGAANIYQAVSNLFLEKRYTQLSKKGINVEILTLTKVIPLFFNELEAKLNKGQCLSIREKDFLCKLSPVSISMQRTLQLITKDAALRIARAWKRSLVHLLKYNANTQKMPHLAFVRLLLKTSFAVKRILLLPKYGKVLDDIIEDVLETRLLEQKNSIKLIFTSVGQQPHTYLPSYIMTHIPSETTLQKHGIAFASKEILKQFRKTKAIPIQSKDVLDKVVKALYATDIFPWYYLKNGCHTRAHITIQFLIALGTSPKSLQKQYVFTSAKTAKTIEDFRGNSISWRYHIAPYVELADKTKWIIDPALDSTKALSLNEWLEKQTTEVENIIDLGTLTTRTISYNPNEDLIFTTSRNAIIETSPSYQITIKHRRRNCGLFTNLGASLKVHRTSLESDLFPT